MHFTHLDNPFSLSLSMTREEVNEEEGRLIPTPERRKERKKERRREKDEEEEVLRHSIFPNKIARFSPTSKGP